MRLFNIDFHISVVADLQHIFKNLGHELDDWCLSGHHWVMGKEKKKIPLLDGWEKIIENKLWDKFSETYPELGEYDGFVCTYPPSFAMLYQNYNKPIIMHCPIRYEHPFSLKPKEWEYFNEWIRERMDSGMLIVVCNSAFEKKYFESFVGREAHLIPNLCEYTGMQYNPSEPPFIYSQSNHGIEALQCKKDVGRFEWKDICKHRAMIHFPYQISTMSIYEQYTANIPLFFPSKETILDMPGLLSEVTWHKLFGRPEVAGVPGYDMVANWREHIELADYYQWPHIQYFDSTEDLFEKVRPDISHISNAMKEENVKRKQLVYGSWKNILRGLSGV